MEDKKLKILLVDDDEETRSIYAEFFKNDGFEVMEAFDGVEGLDKATKETPDVIFTGIIMPRMDGFSMMEALKKNVTTSNIPVVVSSHMGREEDQKKAYELGAKDFIVRNYNTPKQAVERVKVIFLSEYNLKINPTEMDAPKLAKDLHLTSNGLLCPACGGEMMVKLKISGARDHTFSAKLVCSRCKKAYD